MTLERTTLGINKTEAAGEAHVQIRFSGCVAAGLADGTGQLPFSRLGLPGDLVRPEFGNISQ